MVGSGIGRKRGSYDKNDNLMCRPFLLCRTGIFPAFAGGVDKKRLFFYKNIFRVNENER